MSSGTSAIQPEVLEREKEALEAEVTQDEQELVKLEEEETAAKSVDTEIDELQARIEKLTATAAAVRSRRVRQVATSCVEIGKLVDELEKEKSSKNKLKLIRRITTSTIFSCTDEDGKQILKVKQEKVTQIKIQNKKTLQIIVKEKKRIKEKIVKNKKKIEQIQEQLSNIPGRLL